MEKQISELKELNENEIAEMIYERVNAYWGKFPNIWKYVTIDDMATQVAMDLYRPRKADGVPHIIHYYNTRGERSLKPLIGMIAYNVLVAEARDIHSTGVFNNQARRNVYSAVSLETPVGNDDTSDGISVLGDFIPDEKINISKEIDYVMLFDSLPDKVVEGVFYDMGNGRYSLVSYKTLLNQLLDGYNLTQIGEKLYKRSKSGAICKYRDVSSLVKEMKQTMKDFLKNEYGYTENDYRKGWSL